MLVPIFPLNIVLFPGMKLPLHIFEMRYREMIADCLATGQPFGLVLARDVSADEGICSVGTLAKINEVNRLPDGRLNILTTGESRFRISSLDLSRSYHQAEISLWPDEVIERPIPGGVELTSTAKSTFAAYLNLLLEMMREKPHQFNLPDDQVALSYLIASRLQIDNEEKQALLVLDSAVKRLAHVTQLLKREIALLQRLKDQQMLGPDVNGFSIEYRSPLGGLINLN